MKSLACSAPSHYLSQCWPCSTMHIYIYIYICVTRGQWDNEAFEKVLWFIQSGHKLHKIVSDAAAIALGYLHYNDVIMGAVASQITSLTSVYPTVYSGADQRKLQRSASLAFVRGIHRSPVNSPHKWPVTRKMFPFDDVIMLISTHQSMSSWWLQMPWCQPVPGYRKPPCGLDWDFTQYP